LLQQLGELGTAQARQKLGNIGDTPKKEATASVTLNVDSTEKGKDGKVVGEGHELSVDVRMAVRKTDGKSACKCGGKCGKTCTCGSNCNCGPVPPVPPTPPQPPKPDASCKHGRWFNRKLGVIALAMVVSLCALLGTLAFIYAWNHSSQHTTVIVNPGSTGSTPTNPDPITKPNPTKPDPITRPVAPVDPDACNGCSNNHAVAPSAPPPGFNACATAKTETRIIVPPFAFSNTQNWVRTRVANWNVEVQAGCVGGVVRGFDVHGRLVTEQFYGPSLAFSYRWDIAYENQRTLVERYETYNVFAGRTVYVWDSVGHLVEVQQFDAHQILTSDAVIDTDGKMTVRGYDPANGRLLGTQVYDRASAGAVLSANFYLYEKFKH
jgi:hypothetical protein